MRLQRAAKQACGPYARKVEAIKQSDGSLVLRVQVADQAAEKQVVDTLTRTPTVAVPGVRLEVEVKAR
jgi:hypothetical protein